MTPLTGYRAGDMALRAPRALAGRPQPPLPPPATFAHGGGPSPSRRGAVLPWPPLTAAEARLKGRQTLMLKLFGVRR